MSSPRTSPLREAVVAHGRDLALIRRLFEQAVSETTSHYAEKWGHAPRASVLSGMARNRFMELVVEQALTTGVVVTSEGEDWVRVWLPSLGRTIRLRTRPKRAAQEQGGLFDLDLFGWCRPEEPFMFWRWIASEDRLALSLVGVLTPVRLWGLKCQVTDEIEITADLLAIPASAPPGTGNYDDPLNDFLSRWPTEVPESEEEATDREEREKRDDNGTDSALGDDGN